MLPIYFLHLRLIKVLDVQLHWAGALSTACCTLDEFSAASWVLVVPATRLLLLEASTGEWLPEDGHFLSISSLDCHIFRRAVANGIVWLLLRSGRGTRAVTLET